MDASFLIARVGYAIGMTKTLLEGKKADNVDLMGCLGEEDCQNFWENIEMLGNVAKDIGNSESSVSGTNVYELGSAIAEFTKATEGMLDTRDDCIVRDLALLSMEIFRSSLSPSFDLSLPAIGQRLESHDEDDD